MHERTQGKKIHTRSQRVQDYQKQMSSGLWSLLANEGLGAGGLLTAGPPLPLVVDLHANSNIKGEPPLKLFFYTKSKIAGKK